jgi:HTH-type transcriptional regulator/antitoxin HigA
LRWPLPPNAFAADNVFTGRQCCCPDVERFARKTSVSAGTVAGQYGHNIGTWSRFGKLRESNQDE